MNNAAPPHIYVWTHVLVLRWMCLCSVLVLRHINRRVENKVVCPVSSPVVIYSQRTLFWFAIDASILFVSSGQQPLLRTLRTINSIQLNRHNTRLQIVRNRVVSEEKREPRQNSVSRSGHGQSQVTVAAGGSWRRRSSNEMEDDVTKEMWM